MPKSAVKTAAWEASVIRGEGKRKSMYIIVTNNSRVREEYEGILKNLKVEYLEDKVCMDVLIKVRDYIHQGYRLETHPMAGSVKPNQNPYKSIMISDNPSDQTEFQEFVTVMENCIMICRDFLQRKALPDWSESIKQDFRFVDLSLIKSAADCLK